MQELTVQAVWDDEASVWVATSNDIPGLATEADTLEMLADKLRIMVPELLEANGMRTGSNYLPYRLTAERTEYIHA